MDCLDGGLCNANGEAKEERVDTDDLKMWIVDCLDGRLCNCNFDGGLYRH